VAQTEIAEDGTAVDEYEGDDEHGQASLEACQDACWVVGDSTSLPLSPERDRLLDCFQVEEVDQPNHLAALLYSPSLQGQDQMGDGLEPVEELDSGDGIFVINWQDYIAKYNVEDQSTIQGWFGLKSAQ
jgi:hypothetical protein